MRKELFKDIKRVVVKVGTAVLASPTSGLDDKRIEKIVDEIVDLRRSNREVILVSSGAVGAGMRALGWKEKPRTLPGKQAAAAVGQSHLMHLYERLFRKRKHLVAQILLTQDDLTARKHYLNARHTLMTLLKLNVIPIVNENDSVGVEEIKFGDNDTLSALVTNLMEAELLIILSDIDGLHETDPRKRRGGEPIRLVERIDSKIEALGGGPGEIASTGGMYTKLQAAKIVTNSGEPMVIANGKTPQVMRSILEGEEIGTLFLPRPEKVTSRKRWIAFTRRCCGKIFVDEGAKEALKLKGKSLLPSGIVEVEGDFSEGDMVSVVNGEGEEFARGLANYSSSEIDKVKGAKTKDIKPILGYKYYDEVIHRDNLVIL
ncbi:glutamate 5-kinase [candidate division NPL-UPA2 bacterium]|nr:glutamate 5-kinase [candidate division NPL-UPA2 bacterium]